MLNSIVVYALHASAIILLPCNVCIDSILVSLLARGVKGYARYAPQHTIDSET